MNKVIITPLKNNTNTQLINAYESNPEFGYLRVTQKSLDFSNPSWPKPVVKSAFIKGSIEVLEMVVSDSGIGHTLDGQVCVQEFLASAVPANLKREFYFKDDSGNYDEQRSIDAYTKKAGSDEDALACTVNGEPVLRFSFYDPTLASKNISVAHDNGSEISEMALAKRSAAATLPTAGN